MNEVRNEARVVVPPAAAPLVSRMQRDLELCGNQHKKYVVVSLKNIDKNDDTLTLSRYESNWWIVAALCHLYSMFTGSVFWGRDAQKVLCLDIATSASALYKSREWTQVGDADYAQYKEVLTQLFDAAKEAIRSCFAGEEVAEPKEMNEMIQWIKDNRLTLQKKLEERVNIVNNQEKPNGRKPTGFERLQAASAIIFTFNADREERNFNLVAVHQVKEQIAAQLDSIIDQVRAQFEAVQKSDDVVGAYLSSREIFRHLGVVSTACPLSDAAKEKMVVMKQQLLELGHQASDRLIEELRVRQGEVQSDIKTFGEVGRIYDNQIELNELNTHVTNLSSYLTETDQKMQGALGLSSIRGASSEPIILLNAQITHADAFIRQKREELIQKSADERRMEQTHQKTVLEGAAKLKKDLNEATPGLKTELLQWASKIRDALNSTMIAAIKDNKPTEARVLQAAYIEALRLASGDKETLEALAKNLDRLMAGLDVSIKSLVFEALEQSTGKSVVGFVQDWNRLIDRVNKVERKAVELRDYQMAGNPHTDVLRGLERQLSQYETCAKILEEVKAEKQKIQDTHGSRMEHNALLREKQRIDDAKLKKLEAENSHIRVLVEKLGGRVDREGATGKQLVYAMMDARKLLTSE
ncbi:MAG: hypothetical protein H0X51_04310 [Parachlamydiaceae bacterium]|nr:hypothetical protein [Parachlamydiaceae bacterium]